MHNKKQVVDKNIFDDVTFSEQNIQSNDHSLKIAKESEEFRKFSCDDASSDHDTWIGNIDNASSYGDVERSGSSWDIFQDKQQSLFEEKSKFSDDLSFLQDLDNDLEW